MCSNRKKYTNKLEVIMGVLVDWFWTKAEMDKPLTDYVDPDLSNAGIPEDKQFKAFVLLYAGESGIEVLHPIKWPNGWMKLTAVELADAI